MGKNIASMFLAIFVSFALLGCAGMPTMTQLEKEKRIKEEKNQYKTHEQKAAENEEAIERYKAYGEKAQKYSAAYQSGQRNAAKLSRHLREEKEKEYARVRGELDGYYNIYNPFDFSGKHYQQYVRNYERVIERATNLRYAQQEHKRYDAGWNDFWGKSSRRSRRSEYRYDEREYQYGGDNPKYDYALDRALVDANFGVFREHPVGVKPEYLKLYYQAYDEVVEELRLREEESRFRSPRYRNW